MHTCRHRGHGVSQTCTTEHVFVVTHLESLVTPLVPILRITEQCKHMLSITITSAVTGNYYT